MLVPFEILCTSSILGLGKFCTVVAIRGVISLPVSNLQKIKFKGQTALHILGIAKTFKHVRILSSYQTFPQLRTTVVSCILRPALLIKKKKM